MKNKNLIFAGTIFFIICLYLFNGAFEENNFLFGADTLALSLPFKAFAKEMLLKYHSLPLWLPHIFFGTPLIDSTNLIFFYPTDFLFYFLSIPLTHTYIIDFIIHLILAFYGMYLFLKSFELKQEAAILGGMFYMLSGIMVSFAYVGHFGNIKAAALIPFIFYFTKKGIDEQKFFYFLTAALFFGLQILGIGMQIMAYTYFAVILFLFYELFFVLKDIQKSKKIIIYFVISTVAILLFGALQFFQSMAFTKYSWRANFNYENFISWSFHPKEIISFFLPQFFGLKDNTYWGAYEFNQTTYYFGVITFLFIPFGFFIKKYKNTSIFLGVSAFLFLILGFGGYTPFYKLFYYIPIFNSFRNPSRFLYIFTFFTITLASIGFNNILLFSEKKLNEEKEKNEKLFKLFYFVSLIIILFSFIVILFLNTDFTKKIIYLLDNGHKKEIINNNINLITGMIKEDVLFFILISFGFLVLIYLMLKNKIKSVFIIFSLILILHCIDMARINKKFIFFSDIRQFTNSNSFFEQIFKNDNSIFRVADFSNIWYPPNMNIFSKIETISGYHGLVPLNYYKLLKDQVFNNIIVNNIFNVKYYIFNTDNNMPGLLKIFDSERIKIYKSVEAMERFVFYDKILKFKSENEMINYMKGLIKIPEQIFLFDDVQITDDTVEKKYEIKVLEYMPTHIKLKINTNKDGLLFASLMYYPRWRAKVNNMQTKIYRANYDGIGIFVKKGENLVELYYDSIPIWVSFLLTIFIMIFYFIFFKIEYIDKKLKN